MNVDDDHELAARYTPQLMLDRNEPYRPYAMGYTVFRANGQSPSTNFEVVPRGALAIEYAIYYDWDIGHLYELEHIWVHVGADGTVVATEASAHGGRHLLDAGSGGALMRDGRPLVYADAGKHAHCASPDLMTASQRISLNIMCGPGAGVEGVHLGNPFAQRGDFTVTEEDHRLARLKMRRDAFIPAFLYDLYTGPIELMPWPELASIIPGRVLDALAQLRQTAPCFAAIFLDCGDTLIDERTEIRATDSEVVREGDLIPGAAEMVRALKAAGYPLVLVADGLRQSFVNLLGQHDLWDQFDAHVISEDVGALKPDARMFDAALAAVGLTRADASRCVMVGNNLSRDIKGANALGITSVFLAWSDLRTHAPADDSEKPDYVIHAPKELPALLNQLEPLLWFRPDAM